MRHNVKRGISLFVSIIIASLLTASLTTLSAESGDGNKTQCSVKGKSAELDFTLKDMNGRDVTLSDQLGNVILLDFWATWCGPCRIEIPGFIEMYEKYKTRGFSVLGISIDDPVDALQIYANELEMNYPVLVGDGREDVKEAFGPLFGYPTTFIIDRNGTICHQHTGFADRDQFEREINSLL